MTNERATNGQTDRNDSGTAEVSPPSESNVLFNPPSRVRDVAYVKSMAQYREMYERSLRDPEGFWKDIAEDFYWKQGPKGKFVDYNIDVRKGPVYIRWLEGAKTNISYNLLDRNVERGLGSTAAYHWEGNDPDDTRTITYQQLLDEVCQFANVLKSKGLKREDTVALYMPMIPELVVAMLACTRLGIVHSIVFAGFSKDSLAERMKDAKCKMVVTADGVWRGNKLVNLKEIVDQAVAKAKELGHEVKHTIVVRHLTSPTERRMDIGKRPYSGLKISWDADVDSWWHEDVTNQPTTCTPEWMDAESPLFLLYTSGSTGKPKGILHTTAGYMLFTATTFKYVFDYHPGDVYFCTADIGWITGHSYVVYGVLANGATSVMFEGVPFYPDAGRLWAIVDKYRVTQFYTAPTAVRALMKYGDQYVKKYDRRSLRILGSVGEPINPEAWLWYHRVVGNSNCAIVDTFWQTETGGHVLTPLPGATPAKPGSATFPFFGVEATILDEQGKEVEGEAEGYLVFKKPWPSMMRTVYGNHVRFETTYFKKFPGYYCTGDGARRDKDGYFWVTGRMDDMLNVSGHLLSTAEVESALIEHRAVSESAVVARPHAVKGECLYCFVVLKEGNDFSDRLVTDLKEQVRNKIGPFATPEYIHYAPGLPKTRSGKIMRRVLRQIAQNNRQFGDLSTLADDSVVEALFKTRPAID
ncbi:acetyl-coenzyme A synthetase, cytoplasmic [Ixodes scapularis]|uniref:acetyl-coenzyme A synthetase, cytoplasmic n=1 Tax=Ixodes scapularis TaxID=6945 RepID=UPI001C391A26|nr:acetyl-coenzyme A synthetase, cytoplasmic [Ixodes scapularis]